MQGGLIGLAAATVGLSTEAAQHLEVRVEYNFFFFQCIFSTLFVKSDLNL